MLPADLPTTRHRGRLPAVPLETVRSLPSAAASACPDSGLDLFHHDAGGGPETKPDQFDRTVRHLHRCLPAWCRRVEDSRVGLARGRGQGGARPRRQPPSPGTHHVADDAETSVFTGLVTIHPWRLCICFRSPGSAFAVNAMMMWRAFGEVRHSAARARMSLLWLAPVHRRHLAIHHDRCIGILLECRDRASWPLRHHVRLIAKAIQYAHG